MINSHTTPTAARLDDTLCLCALQLCAGDVGVPLELFQARSRASTCGGSSRRRASSARRAASPTGRTGVSVLPGVPLPGDAQRRVGNAPLYRYLLDARMRGPTTGNGRCRSIFSTGRCTVRARASSRTGTEYLLRARIEARLVDPALRQERVRRRTSSFLLGIHPIVKFGYAPRKFCVTSRRCTSTRLKTSSPRSSLSAAISTTSRSESW